MKNILYLIIPLLILNNSLAENSSSNEKGKDQKTIQEKESDLIDFNSIKKVLKSDQLTKQVTTKTRQIKKLKKKRVLNRKLKYDIPDKNNIWTFMSEIWLVKNSAVVRWDFKKPDYGIEGAFKSFLEKHGYYEKTIKILLVDTPNITHMGIPSNPGEYIFLLSIPFVRTLDLSKLEISILLFEDFLRLQKNYFKNYVSTNKMNNIIGSNFQGSKFNSKEFKKVFKNYDDIIFAKGFTFQQQFEVTKSVSAILKSDLKLWNTYLSMLKKIDDLVKTNLLYSNYVKIFPSPELQINWLKPKRSVL